jgi:formylmethanofuran dehydrogenase subunit E
VESFDDLLLQAEAAHGHLCAGQILGVRMAILACRLLHVDDPRGADRKTLVTWVEIDRCATDAIGLVTGCKLGRRALKFRDWGKMAATFLNLTTGLAVRIVALETSRDLARLRFPAVENKSLQQQLAYRELTDEELFHSQWVTVDLPATEIPGFKGPRVTCAQCGEGINFSRYVTRPGPGGQPTLLCLTCADPTLRYWRLVGEA